MLRQIADMPSGTVGFEAFGTVDDDDFEDTVEPVLRQAVAAGDPLRVLYLLGEHLHRYDTDTVTEELKFAARHPSAYERVAVVSDEEWLRPALRVLSVLVPGQLRGFPVAELAAAKTWVAGSGDRHAPSR